MALDVPLPADVAVGAGTAIFVCGWCFCPDAAINSLHVLLDGVRQPLMAFAMPRLDPFAELHPRLNPYATGGLTHDPDSRDDPALHSYRSGFWGLVRIAGTVAVGHHLELALEARLADGTASRTVIGEVEVVRVQPEAPARPATPAPDAGPLVAICMATHNPPADLLEHQLASIRAQTHRRWICLISDDCSAPERFEVLQRLVGDDPRFAVSRSPQRLDFYRNFERALAMVPPEADLVALADQDDRWDEDKLATLIEALGEARLVYSDARVVDRDGTTISDTYWSVRRPNHHDMLSLLVANSVSGSATLLRRDLLDDALPFPPAQFAHYHDHWLALVALAQGEIRFVKRPLYDYVQHGQAALGHDAANRMPTLRERLRRRDRRDSVRMWRLHYFVDHCRLLQCVAILQLRLGDRMRPDSDRVLRRFAAAEDSPAQIGRLAARGAREMGGRGETLGAEWMLFCALAWRRLLTLTARDRPQRRLRLDAVPPPDLAPRAGRRQSSGSAVETIAAKIAPLKLAPSADEPVRVNLLVPTIDLQHFFGGYIAKFNLARRLAEAGIRVRIVTVDPVAPLPRSWKQTIESYAGLSSCFDHLEVAFGREQAPVPVSPSDHFIATTWWTAHVAHAASQSLGGARFVYLIQEYEPFTFPMGSYAALAAGSYELPHHALFSSELLREYFRRHGIGVFAADGAHSASFQNAITPVHAPPAAQLRDRAIPRLLLYARPEAHASRNMFELAVLALERALAEGRFAGWELRGIGSVGESRRLTLSGGAVLELLPRTDERAYAEHLRAHDVGLALMYTPHPSLVPLEMAAAGMLAVTNTFEHKTAEALAAISTNLIAAPPTIDGVAAALGRAQDGAARHDERVAGSDVHWSRDWHESLPDALLAEVIGWLRG